MLALALALWRGNGQDRRLPGEPIVMKPNYA
jgi:hypothetical protein